jgi:glycosyltransferase involved in cell wall biosynthesis/GT2 family glycosyltransferase
LRDAVVSAVRQTYRDYTKIIIVNDGCPHSSTESTGKLFSDAFPDEVYYLRKRNAGVSSARNYGISFALTAWPSVQAVFPLDADNKLSPSTLERLWRRLVESEADVGWVYQDLENFGGKEFLWRTGIPFNRYRLIHENICDTGSLIHRKVFDEGIWFDEQMTAGYEDWEFFVNAAARGFRGVHLSDTGFLYRKRSQSHNDRALSQHDRIYDYLTKKRHFQLNHDELTSLEHKQMPRYALVSIDTDSVRCVTDPTDDEAGSHTVTSFKNSLVAWEREIMPKTSYIPPIVVFSSSASFDLLKRLRLLPGLLFVLQQRLHAGRGASLGFQLANDAHRISLSAQRDDRQSILLAMTFRKLIDLAKSPGDDQSNKLDDFYKSLPEQLMLHVGSSHLRSANNRWIGVDCQALAAQLHNGLLAFSRSMAVAIETSVAPLDSRRPESGPSSHSEFALTKHVDQVITSFPKCTGADQHSRRPRNILFALPWIGMGGLEGCVLNLAKELSTSSFRIHGVVTSRNDIEADPELLSSFDTLTFLPSDSATVDRTLVQVMSMADVVINAHSAAAYNVLPELRRQSNVRYISYLHVVDKDDDGFPGGYPIIALRQFDDFIDHYAVISEHLRRMCLNFGVADERITLVPNAPSVSPASRESALEITNEKCRRTYSEDRPVRILFSGRFDHQKGIDRIEKVAAQLRKTHLPYELQLLGKAVLSRSQSSWTIPGATILPGVISRSVLARHYAAADILLLPSRWEGVPLAILEAMSFGNIVIATNVGAVQEVVRNGENGILVDGDSADEAVVRIIEAVVSELIESPHRFDQLRHNACLSGISSTWSRSAQILNPLLKE